MFKARFTRFFLMGLAFTIAVSSCKKDEEPGDKPNTQDSRYVLQVRSWATNGQTADYIVVTDSLMSGEISLVGNGKEQLGWRTCVGGDNKVFSIGYGDQYTIGYGLDQTGSLTERGKFTFEKTLDCLGSGDTKTTVAIEAPRAGLSKRVIHLIDMENISVKNKIETDIYLPEGDTTAKWPTAIITKGNTTFISYYPVAQSNIGITPNVDTAYVAVYSYPDFKLQKVLKDPRTSPIGLYGDSNGLIETDNGDIYSISTSSFACGFTKVTKPSGILRIKSGSTEFDKDYFFDIEAATGGLKLQRLAYVGNGLAVARMVINDTQLPQWAAFRLDAMVCKLVVVDLVNKTVRDVDGTPIHGGQYSTPAFTENGKIYWSIFTLADGNYIYEIDPAKATSKKGAKILAQEVAGFFKLSKN